MGNMQYGTEADGVWLHYHEQNGQVGAMMIMADKEMRGIAYRWISLDRMIELQNMIAVVLAELERKAKEQYNESEKQRTAETDPPSLRGDQGTSDATQSDNRPVSLSYESGT